MLIDPQFYAVRWVTTLFSRELPMEQVLRVWDSLLADPERFLLMYCIGLALMEQEKEKLIVDVSMDLMITCKFFRI